MISYCKDQSRKKNAEIEYYLDNHLEYIKYAVENYPPIVKIFNINNERFQQTK